LIWDSGSGTATGKISRLEKNAYVGKTFSFRNEILGRRSNLIMSIKKLVNLPLQWA
jgi:hypothetical protein